MSLSLGNTTIGSLYLGSTKIGAAYLGNVKVYESGDPYNPLNLPPYTIRCKFSSGYTPDMGDSQTLVDASDNVWDITLNNTVWGSLFLGNTNIIEVLGANTTGVTDMSWTFYGCSSLTSVPLFDTSSCTNMSSMFRNCFLVQSGALALYQQASTQAITPQHNSYTFQNCGRDTISGAAELAQIPSSWGGTGA